VEAGKRARESKHGGGKPSRKREKSKEEARCQRRRNAPMVGVAVVVYGGYLNYFYIFLTKIIMYNYFK